MKFDPSKKITNPKQLKKLEQERRDQESAVARHADYEKKREAIVAPFGKAFKTGGHKSEKSYKREKPQKGKDW
jgi:hypothetical protein